MKPLRNAFLCAACLLLGYAGPASGADHKNLEDGLPIEVTDAYTTGYRNRELQGIVRWERTDKDTDRLRVEPRFEYGIARNWQVSLKVPFFVGNAERTGSGDVHVEALHNFNTESRLVPAFAVSGSLDIPTGKDTAGVDPTLKFIASKMLIPSMWLHAVHVNIAWTYNSGSTEEERNDMYKAVFGVSAYLARDAYLVADVVREQEREKGEESNMAELGIRYMLTPLTVVSLGGGVGFGDESPDFRTTLGFQKSF